VTRHTEQRQDGADKQDNDADRPADINFRDNANDEKDYAEDDQKGLLVTGR
jgi:hypothetical protein